MAEVNIYNHDHGALYAQMEPKAIAIFYRTVALTCIIIDPGSEEHNDCIEK